MHGLPQALTRVAPAPTCHPATRMLRGVKGSDLPPERQLFPQHVSRRCPASARHECTHHT
eukprot:15004118-Alexandrium_andersonii.AAC.1